MADLSNEHRIFIVRRLASMMTPQEVADAVKEEFDGLEVSRQQVRHYNPEQSPDLAAEWRELFEAERERFLTQLEEIPIANKAVRLRWLNAGADKARQAKNWMMVAKLSEQAAKEMGGVFTNRTELTGAGGGSVEVEVKALVTDYRQAAAALAPPPDAEQIPLPLPELGDDEDATGEEAQVLDDDLPDADDEASDEAAIDGTDRF